MGPHLSPFFTTGVLLFLIALVTRDNGPLKQPRADAFSTEGRGGLYSERCGVVQRLTAARTIPAPQTTQTSPAGMPLRRAMKLNLRINLKGE
jgi:hypothetical protein